jgi:hypothetical protein
MADEGAGSGLSQTRYARTIERRWSELQEEPRVLSRRDWDRIDRWYELGIPLQLIEEAMVEAAEEGRAARRAPRLSELSSGIEQAWEGIVQGRRKDLLEAPAGADEPLDRWRSRLEAAEAGSPLRRLLGELLDRRSRGATAAELDSELDRRLLEAVPPELAKAVEAELADELAPYRDRLSPERLRATQERARGERLRRRLDLPRLAGGEHPA